MWSESALVDVAVPPRIDYSGDVERLRAEIAELQAERDTLHWAVGHDELTGLPNRRLFSAIAPDELASAPVAVVLLLDLDGFKPINDAYGHEAGDRVLQVVARRLDNCVHQGLIARLGGDEFVGVLIGAAGSHPSWWAPTVTGLLNEISTPMTIANRRMSVTGSIGVATVDGPISIGDLMHRADMAMYEAKIHGRGYALWSPEIGSGGAHMRPPKLGVSSMTIVPDEAADIAALDPYLRDPAHIAPAGSYSRADMVWVHREGQWHPGVVESAFRRAVTATYLRNPGGGTVVDTMGAECVMTRNRVYPQLDQMMPSTLPSDRFRDSA